MKGDILSLFIWLNFLVRVVENTCYNCVNCQLTLWCNKCSAGYSAHSGSCVPYDQLIQHNADKNELIDPNSDGDDSSNSDAVAGGIAGVASLFLLVGVGVAAVLIIKRTRRHAIQDDSANQPPAAHGMQNDRVQYEELTERPDQISPYMELNITEYETVDELPQQCSGSQVELQNAMYQNV